MTIVVILRVGLDLVCQSVSWVVLGQRIWTRDQLCYELTLEHKHRAVYHDVGSLTKALLGLVSDRWME